MEKTYSYKYKGQRQDVRWDRAKLEAHMLAYLKANKAEDYEVIEITERSLGTPKLEQKVVF